MRVRKTAAIAAAGATALAIATPAFGAGMGATQVALGQSGEREAITPLRLTDNVPGYQIEAGKRVVCLRVKVRNVGKKTFTEFVGTGGKLRLRGGVTENASITGGGACPSSGTIKLRPGKTTTVYLPYKIRKSDRVVGFEYTASSGFGKNTPRWSF
jgi:hypothetical protein